jgi:hypothetical protein
MLDCVLHTHIDNAGAPSATGPPHSQIERSQVSSG